MLNLFQHLTKSWTYETLKRVQGDRLRLFTRPSQLNARVGLRQMTRKLIPVFVVFSSILILVIWL
jgi:hypothetical protein